MNKALFTCKNCGEKFFEKDAIKVKQGYSYIISCPKCGSLRPVGTMSLDINNNMEEEDLDLKFKAGDNEDAVKTVIMYKETHPTTWITVEKAADVFAEMLVELCPELLGFGGAAKEWENEFRKRLEE